METLTLAENPACNPYCRVCHYKDLDYPSQLARKRRWAESQLGRWADRLAEIVPAPESERLGYRGKTWLRVQATGGAVSFGMFRAIPVGEKWGKEFISWDTCPMHLPGIQATLPGLGRALAEHAPAWTERSLFGVWIGTPHLVLVAKEPPPTALRDANWSVLLTEPLREVGFHLTNQVGKTVFGEGPIESIYRKPARTLTMAGKDSVPPLPICAFRQIALTLVDRARGEAVAELLEPKPALVLDLYCGTGEIARRLPPETGWIGVEASAEAATYAGKIRADGRIAHAAFVGFVEHRLRDSRVRERIGDDYAIYVNPPRPGLGDAGRELLLDLVRERRPKSIVYLSCSASSLARDLGALESVGARVESLRPFDFFPQTEHFETLAVLKI